MGVMWPYPEELRPEFKHKVDAAIESCKINPDDLEAKKNLINALTCLATCEGASDAQDMKLLHDAVSVWKEILDINPQDHRARFEMGLVYYTMVIINSDKWSKKIVDYDAKLDACDKAIDCFQIVGEEAPEIYRDYYYVDESEIAAPNVHEKIFVVKKIKAQFMEDFEMGSEDIASFMTESVLHPNNAEIWKKWGIALMRLSCQESGNKKKRMVAEAISKLKNALSIYPNDVEAKDLLIESYNQLLSEHCLFEDGSGEAMSSTGNFEVAELKTNIKRRREAC